MGPEAGTGFCEAIGASFANWTGLTGDAHLGGMTLTL